VEKRIRWDANLASAQAQGPRARKRQAEEAGCRSLAGQCDPEGGHPGKLISPARGRRAVERVQQTLGVSERRACRVLAQPRSTQRFANDRAGDEAVLTEHIVELASQYGRYGYRRITVLLRN